MSGSQRGPITMVSLPKSLWPELKAVFEAAYKDLLCAETPETFDNLSPSSTMKSLPGLQVVAELYGSPDRAGRHTSLLSVSSARITEMEND
jgi:hypothetical protein